MNAIRSLTTVALLLASGVTLAAAPTGELRWDCSRKGAPSYHEIAKTFGFDNYELARNAQPRLYHQLRRECARGADTVVMLVTPRQTIEVETEAVAAR